jgi:hypothetical protein
MITISMVPSEHIDTCWEEIEPFLEGAARHTYGRFTVDNIYDRIVEDGYHLWVAYTDERIKGAVVTNVMNYPHRKVLSMTYCGGEDLVEWKDPMLAMLRRFAKDVGCDGIEAVARKGWAKIFKNDGHKECWSTFELPL